MLRLFFGVLLVAGLLAPDPASAGPLRARRARVATHEPAPAVVAMASDQVSAPVVPYSAEPAPAAVVASNSSATPVAVNSHRVHRLRHGRSERRAMMVYGP